MHVDTFYVDALYVNQSIYSLSSLVGLVSFATYIDLLDNVEKLPWFSEGVSILPIRRYLHHPWLILGYVSQEADSPSNEFEESWEIVDWIHSGNDLLGLGNSDGDGFLALF